MDDLQGAIGTVDQTTKQRPTVTEIGRYHELCARCKRLAQALSESFTTGRCFGEAARQQGFQEDPALHVVSLEINEGLLPDVCHLCAIIKAMSKPVSSGKTNGASAAEHEGYVTATCNLFKLLPDSPAWQQHLEKSVDGARIFIFRVHFESQSDKYESIVHELVMSSYNGKSCNSPNWI